MHVRGLFRSLSVVLLVTLLLAPATGLVRAGAGEPATATLTVLPPGSDVAVVQERPSASATKGTYHGLEDALAQLATAHRSVDKARLAALSADRNVNVAAGNVRVILEMAAPPTVTPIAKPALEVVELPGGQRANIERAARVAIVAELDASIAATGATYETAYENRVQVLAPFDSLVALSELPGVTYVRLPYPVQQLALPARGSAAPDAPQVGTQTSEGVALTGASTWHGAGYNGAGVNLAVFDFGFTGWATRQAAGDLPSGDQLVLKDYSASYSFDPDTAGNIHGTACAEIAYDMAPGSTVYLYAWSTDVEFGNAVDDFISHVSDKKVATMSIGFVNAGPYDGTGSINTIVNNAEAAGIFWANSAGNSQKTHYSGTSAQYSNGDSVAFGAGNIEGYGSTPGLVYNIATGTRITAFLEWNDWNDGRTGNQNHIDYDLVLYRWTGSAWTQVASSLGDQCGTTATPTESIAYTVPANGPYNYGLLIQRYQGGGACPNSFGHWLTLHSFLSAGASNLWWYVNNCNGVTIPADGDSAVAVGATFWNEDATAPLYGLETFSSCGARNAAGGAAPGAAVNKPDVVAPDGVSTAAYGASNGVSYASGGSGFWGTSGAAPHVAGLAATAWSGRPDLTLAQLRSNIQSKAAVKGDGGTCGASGAQNNRYGWGRIALGALPVAGLWDGGGTTNDWSQAENWDNGAVPGAGTPILFNATSTKNATVNGAVSAASLTMDSGYTGAVTLGGSLTVSGDLALNSGSLDVSVSNYPLTIGGNFTRSGGTFAPHTGTVTFNGIGTKSISGDTTFYNLVVGSGLTLATSNNVTVSGALTNSGSTQETKSVGGVGLLSFGLANIGVNVTTAGSLSSLAVLRRDQSYSGAPPGILTGKYWTITPTGTNYGVGLTLPHNGLADPSICRKMGDSWDCAYTSRTGTTVTRSGVAELSDWAVGNTIQPAVAPSVAASLDLSGNSVLDWTPIPADAGGYDVWWNSDPFFTPGAGLNHEAVAAPTATYTHAGTPGENYYYVVLGVNGAGQPSGNSNRTGKFVFSLTPGTP